MKGSLTVGDALREAETGLEAAGVPQSSVEARELLACALRCRRMDLLARLVEPVSPARWMDFQRYLAERLTRRPLAYIFQEWDFLDMRLRVTEDVLVPRPETEELFEWAAEIFTGSALPKKGIFVDVGTGSGCVAIALARRFPMAEVVAVDVSAKALDVARGNAAAHGVAERISFIEGDLLSSVSQKVDVIVANLPYIDRDDIEGLDPEVRNEPRVALDGGEEGLELIRRLLPQAINALVPGGSLFLEVGYNQTGKVEGDLRRAGFRTVEARRDISGVERFLRGVKTDA